MKSGVVAASAIAVVAAGSTVPASAAALSSSSSAGMTSSSPPLPSVSPIIDDPAIVNATLRNEIERLHLCMENQNKSFEEERKKPIEEI